MGTNSAYKEHCQQQLRKSWETQDWMAAQTRRSNAGGGGGGGSCFAADTPIETPHGAIPIALVQVGSLVSSLNVKAGNIEPRHVLKVPAYRSGRLWTVTLDRGNAPLRVTRRHSFLTARGWQQAGSLVEGDWLQHHDGGLVRVVRAADSGISEPVFNLISEDDHTYFAGGVAVHNFTYLRECRVWLYRTARLFSAAGAARSAPQPAAR